MPRVGALIRGQLRELRGQLRYALGLVLQRLLRRRTPAGLLDGQQVHSVLIVRINGRLGNTLFLTPLLERLHALLPQARIDLALSYPHAPALLDGLPGVRQIILFPHRGVARLGEYWRALRQLRASHYDLAIDPTPFSTSGRLILSLTHARFRLGFSVPSQWAALTHAVPLPQGTLHQGRQAAYLLTRALGAAWDPDAVRLWLPLSAAEIAAARAQVHAALHAAGASADGAAVVGYFGHATGLKALSAQWWRRFWQALRALRPQLVTLEFLPAAAAVPTVAGFATLHLPSQRQLTAAISTLQLFVCADAGPMHLASTTDTPTVALFQATDAALYGPLKRSDRSIEVGQRTPEEVAAALHATWPARGP